MNGTLRLSPSSAATPNSPGWDLTVDSSGNIATLSGIDAVLQDVASSIRCFRGELWYDTSQGVPYFASILGHMPPPQLLKAQLEAAALTVPLVTAAVVAFTRFSNRSLSGTIAITASVGSGTVSFGAQQGSGEIPWYVSASASASQ